MSASIVAGVAQSALSGLANWLQGEHNVNMTKELMDYQAKKELENQSILNQRLYPQQVASMRMAGLNPAMMSAPMSQGASTPNANMNMAAPPMDVVSPLSIGSQIDLNKANERLLAAQSNYYDEQAKKVREDTTYQSFMNDVFFDNYARDKAEQLARTKAANGQADVFYQSLKNMQQEYAILGVELENTKLKGEELREKIKTILPIARAQIAEMYSNVKLNDKYMKQLDQAIEESGARVGVMAYERQYNEVLVRMGRIQADILEEYGPDSAQAQIVGQYFGVVGQLLNAGANVYSVRKGVPMSSTTTTHTYNGKGVHTGTTESTTTKH